MNYFIPLCLFFVLFSCKKEKTQEVTEELSAAVQDQYLAEVTSSLMNSSLGQACHDNSITLAESYQAMFEYRFIEGEQVNGAYLYGIEKRFRETFFSQTGMETSWADTSDWQPISKYYRYAFDENISYLYNGLNDPNPLVLFDFNVLPGDTVNLTSHLPNYDILVEILDVSYLNVNNLNYPIVSCKLASCSNCFFTLSPDLPNPFAFEEVQVHAALIALANIPQCNQSTGISFGRSGKDFTGNWAYYLLID